MSNFRKTSEMMQTSSWTWHVMPVLIVAAALNTLFVSAGTDTAAATAAMPIAAEASAYDAALVPSPQPGMGEPALRAEDLPQSY
jgi:hypothetical protein